MNNSIRIQNWGIYILYPKRLKLFLFFLFKNDVGVINEINIIINFKYGQIPEKNLLKMKWENTCFPHISYTINKTKIKTDGIYIFLPTVNNIKLMFNSII